MTPAASVRLASVESMPKVEDPCTEPHAELVIHSGKASTELQRPRETTALTLSHLDLHLDDINVEMSSISMHRSYFRCAHMSNLAADDACLFETSEASYHSSGSERYRDHSLHQAALCYEEQERHQRQTQLALGLWNDDD